jgi:hypothetical protein
MESDRHEVSLAEWGAVVSDPPPPTQLLVWEPEQFKGAADYLDREEWWDGVIYCAGNCLKATQPGTRAAIYESGEGIVGFWDFSGHAAKVRGTRTRFMATGVYRPIEGISRAELVASRPLRDRFRTMVAHGALTPAQGRAVVDLAALRASIPRFIRFVPPEWADPADRTTDIDWVDRDRDWGCEHPIQMALYKHSTLWRRLGFTRQPTLEAWLRDRTSRYDLIDRRDRVVVEVKYKAKSADLGQLRRYIDRLERDHGGTWRGHLVFGSGGGSLLKKVANDDHYDITAWELSTGRRGLRRTPRLKQLARSRKRR